jgi:ABC-type transport system substrate-binding protein
MGRYLTRQALIAIVLWGAAAAGVIYLVAGSSLGGGGDNQASARPTATRATGTPGSSDAIATFTPTRVAATPATTPTPGPTKQPDRTSCAAIRGTDYRSDTERAYFLANCSSTSSSGGGGGAPTSTPQTGGGGGAPAPTSTKPPTEVHHIIKDNGGTLSPDIATSWTISDDRFVLTLTLKSGLQRPDGSPLDANALVEVLNASRSSFEQPLFTFFTAVNPTTVAIRVSNKIAPSIYTTLSAIEIVIKTP